MAGENEISYLFEAPSQGASSVGTLAPAASGASTAISSLLPIIGPLATIIGGFSKIFAGPGQAKQMQAQDAEIRAQQQAAQIARDDNVRNGWKQQAEIDFNNLVQNSPAISQGIQNGTISSDEVDGLKQFVVQRAKAIWEYANSTSSGYKQSYDTGNRAADAYNTPQAIAATETVANYLKQLEDKTGVGSSFQSQASTPLTSTAGQDISLDPNSPTLGATSPQGTSTGATTQPTTQQAAGTQGATQQNWLQKLMSAFQGPGNNNVLAQAGQGAGIGAGNSMGLNPALGGVVGAGLGQIGSAFGNLVGGSSQAGNQQSGQQPQQQPQQQPPQQPSGFGNQNFMTGISTGSEQSQSNPLNDLFAAFGIQNPAQAGLGAGILGLGSALEKDVTLPDFWSDRGVQDLYNFGNSATHPLDPNVDSAIQRSMDIQNEQQLRNLRDVYKNARPGGDYLNDSAYQRDLDNLNRKMALNTADAKAGSQLQSNAQQIGVKTDLAAGSVGQGRAQALLDTQKQTNQNKLFGDLGSAFIQGSLQKPPTTNLQVNR